MSRALLVVCHSLILGLCGTGFASATQIIRMEDALGTSHLFQIEI